MSQAAKPEDRIKELETEVAIKAETITKLEATLATRDKQLADAKAAFQKIQKAEPSAKDSDVLEIGGKKYRVSGLFRIGSEVYTRDQLAKDKDLAKKVVALAMAKTGQTSIVLVR